MAAQLGLPAIPVEREYLQSWKTMRTAWERCRFVAEIPEALDTDAIGRVCEFRVQGERVARPLGRSPEREYFGVGEDAANGSNGSSAGNGAGASSTNAAAGETDRSPTIWRWFADADKRGGAAHAGGGGEPALDVWIAAAAVKPPERARGGSLAFGTPPRSAAARRHKNLLYAVRNKSRQEIDLTREGEALVEHAALNALLFQHGRDAPGVGEPGAVYVTLAGVDPGWEGRELHFAVAARINALGETLGLNNDKAPPIVLVSAPRLPYTAPDHARLGGASPFGTAPWHLTYVVPPAAGGFGSGGGVLPSGGLLGGPPGPPGAASPGPASHQTGGFPPNSNAAPLGGVAPGMSASLRVATSEDPHASSMMRGDAILVNDLAEAMSFAHRARARLAIVGLELEGAHVRAASAVRDPETAREMRRQDLVVKFGASGKHATSHTSHDPDWHWWLQMRDLELAAEAAAGVRASFEAIEHRRLVQEYWLEDWKHRGLTLDAAAELVGLGKRNAAWAKEWFKGYSAPYLDRTPPTSMKWPARAWGWLRGGDTRRRRAGKKYVARNVAPLAAATRRFLEGGVSERRLVEELAAPDASGWAVAGAQAHLEAFRAFRGEEDLAASTREAAFDSGDSGHSPLGGRLTAAQQERERARREAERREALAASASAGASHAFGEAGETGESDASRTRANGASGATSRKELVRDDVDALFRAFKNFRDNVDLMAMRDGAVDDAFVFEILLEDMERRAEEVGAKDVSLAPLHATALDFVVGQLSAYRDALTDDARSVRLMEGDSVYARCHDLLSRAERRRAALEEARGAYVAATRALEAACAEMENGALSGDFDALAGTEEATTFAVGASDAPFSSSSWRDHLVGLHSKVDALSAFEAEVDEATRSEWWDKEPRGDASGERETRPPHSRPAPSWTLTHENLSEALEMDLARTLDFLKDLSFLRDVDVSGTTAKHRAPNTSHEPGARAGAFLKDATRTHDEWTRAMGEADAALRRARLLRSKIAAAVDLIEATEKIDPSGIRRAIEKAKAEGAPALTVQAAEGKLADLEAEIAAFIRHRRAGESLLPPPNKSWVGAGRHIWYDEAKELGRGSLGTTVYAGVYDETAGSSSVVRRPAAIKRIPLPPGERGENTRALVEREVALHRHLNQNSNRVTFLLGAHLDGSDAVFTAMERCGESLAQWLRSAPGGSVANLPPAERIAAAEALTAAVADVHAAGVTHNDIKPDNCLRAASGEFKLADLGLGVRLKTHERGEEKDAMYSMTTFAGYGVNVQLQGRPPEVLLNQNLTAAVDVWSLGNLMYAAFTGAASPFRDEENTSASSGGTQKSSGPLKDKHSPEASGIAGLYENQRIIRGTFSLRALETSKLPRHVVAAARVVLSDMLQPNPEDRPSAEEVLQHPVFWTPEKAVEKIREVNDEKLIPLKDKSGAALTPAEELRLVADVFGGGGVSAEKGERGEPEAPPPSSAARKKGGAHTSARADSSKNTEKRTVHAHAKSARLESVAARLQNWKELVIPELLERVTKYNIKKQYAAGAETLAKAKEEAAAATRSAAAAEAEQSGLVRKKGRKRGSSSLRAAAARGDWDGTGYEPTLRDLFRFIRNVHEHPGLQAERFAMIKALGAAGAHLPKFPEGEDRWGAARRVVEAYVVHVFPELPLLAQALLTKEGRAAAQRIGGARPR